MPVRDATADDAGACAAVYEPYVRDTAITFELDAPDESVMAGRIRQALDTHAWLVAEDDAGVAGYAYGGPFKARPAYRFACETSVYVATGRHGRGTGRALYEALLSRLTARGYRTAIAVMTVPNPASLGLHRALGYEPAGTLHRVGWKLGRWHDVATLQRPLLVAGDPPPEPR